MTPGNRRVKAPTRPLESPALPLESSVLAAPAIPSRFVSAVRTVVGVALVVGSAGGVAWAARRHVTTSSRFSVTRVMVSGNERRPSDAIVAESGIALGANVFGLDLDAARSRLLADPWIAEVTLSRRLPGTVLVAVSERKAAAIVVLGDTFLANVRGEPFKRLEPGDPVDLPTITGLRPESAADDREGTLRAVRRAIDLAAEYERGSLAVRAPLEEVHIDPEGAFTLVVGRPTVQVALGRPPFRRKLDEAARVFAELDRRRAKAEAILLDSDNRPERVVVRMR